MITLILYESNRKTNKFEKERKKIVTVKKNILEIEKFKIHDNEKYSACTQKIVLAV